MTKGMLMHVNTRRPAAAALVAVVVLVLVGLGGAGAGAVDEPPITVDPTTVSDGTPFTVSGEGCVDPETQVGDGHKVYVVAMHLAYPNPDNVEGTLYAIADVAHDGTWSVTTAPDTREEYFGPFDDFDTTVTAYCTPPEGPSQPLFQYATVAMHYVGATPSSTTTATSPPPTASTPTTAPPATAPAPAAPVSGSASFTG